jgi:hypothetical protein
METNLLEALYRELYGDPAAPGKMANLRELAVLLSDIVKREKPWTYRYLNSLLNGDAGFRVTPELEQALQVLATRLDNAHPLQAWLVKIEAYSINGAVQPGSIITGKSERCACGVLFVPHHHFQKYCCPQCPARVKKIPPFDKAQGRRGS